MTIYLHRKISIGCSKLSVVSALFRCVISFINHLANGVDMEENSALKDLPDRVDVAWGAEATALGNKLSLFGQRKLTLAVSHCCHCHGNALVGSPPALQAGCVGVLMGIHPVITKQMQFLGCWFVRKIL